MTRTAVINVVGLSESLLGEHTPRINAFRARGALARGVAKYHDAVLGPTHLLASGIYGYNADYVETAAYALAAQGLTSLEEVIKVAPPADEQ